MKDIKSKIAHNFSRAAANYNDSAQLQKTIAQKLVTLAKPYISSSSRVLDLGSGTGFIAKELGQKIIQADIALGMCKHSNAHSPSICADMESLPFVANSFDVILSASSIQWADVELALKEVGRVLAPAGNFIFSTFGEQTLSEIKTSFSKAGINSNLHQFLSKEKIEKIVSASSLQLSSSSSEEHKLHFASMHSLLSSIKDIGAGAAVHNPDTLTRKKLMQAEDIYKKDFNSDKITANWVVEYYICKKSS